jgi:hypothetical protein
LMHFSMVMSSPAHRLGHVSRESRRCKPVASPGAGSSRGLRGRFSAETSLRNRDRHFLNFR